MTEWILANVTVVRHEQVLIEVPKDASTAQIEEAAAKELRVDEYTVNLTGFEEAKE